jgi:hypothetical protein
MIFNTYLLYTNSLTTESFESTSSSPDDWNAINQLAQMSRQLMAGGLTVPGSLTISGTALNIGTTNVGTTLTSLQSQITALTGTVNTNNTTLTNNFNSLTGIVTANNNNAVKWNSDLRLYTGTGNGYLSAITRGSECNSWTSLKIQQAEPFNHRTYTSSGNC